MGWLKLGNRTDVKNDPPRPIQSDLKAATEHIETVSLQSSRADYPLVSIDLSDDKLPFIAPGEVIKRTSVAAGGIFIIVDNIVYDCTQFISEHPGGEQIILSFGGAECSWQFWRFHGTRELEEFGRPLRVGRTEGVMNKFKEPSKYVGLRKLGADDWF